MVHGDDQGLVLPPKLAPIQVVIVPIIKKTDKNAAEIVAKAHEIGKSLKAQSIRVKVDDRDNYNPGWKYNHWEIKGVCLRIEIGSKDLESNNVVVARRHTRTKFTQTWEGLVEKISSELTQMQIDMFNKAK